MKDLTPFPYDPILFAFFSNVGMLGLTSVSTLTPVSTSFCANVGMLDLTPVSTFIDPDFIVESLA